jgi:hypothetical protein
MSEERRTKCVVEGELLAPCWVLDQAADAVYSGSRTARKGVTMLQLTSFKGGMFAICKSGAVLSSGSLSKKGVLMNFCPFCGASIAEHFKAKAKEGA